MLFFTVLHIGEIHTETHHIKCIILKEQQQRKQEENQNKIKNFVTKLNRKIT